MKRLTIVLPVLLLTIAALGQTDPKENFYDAEFFFMEEEYSEALYAFNKVYNAGFQDNANINYRIGICLLNIRNREGEALPYLRKAMTNLSDSYREGNFNETEAPYDALLYLGNAYRIVYELDSAIKYYEKYKSYLTPKNINEREYSDQQIAACRFAEEQVLEPVHFTAGNLGQINETNFAISLATVSGDQMTTAFMVPQRFYDAIYYSKKVDGKWIKPLNITPTIQSDGNQSVLSLNADGTAMLLSWSDEFDSEIFISKFVNGYWTRSQPIGKPVNSKFYESHACFSPDGKSIYFTSNRRESMGGMDIFRSDYLANGELGEPVNLGANVNTPLNEESPFLSPDGKRLYFSSQGHQSMGGFDIFYCELQADGTWGAPVNLGFPLNTTNDDFTFIPNLIHRDGYLTLYANGNEGQKDLFQFEYIPNTATPVLVDFEQEDMEFNVADVLPKKPVAEPVAELVEEVPAEDVLAETTQETALEELADTVAVVAEEVLAVEEQVEEKPVYIEPKPAERFVIQPLFFAFDKSVLTANSVEKLNNLAKAMKEYPELNIKVIGHTDAVGDENYNLWLSRQRAEVAAAYLIQQGISKDRITVAASGELHPAAINRTADGKDSPRGRELNRRVMFEISLTNGLIMVESVKVPDELKLQ